MRWLAISVRTSRPAAEAVTAVLTEAAGAVSIDDPTISKESLLAGRADFVDLPPADPDHITITAYLPETADLHQDKLAVLSTLEQVNSLGLGEVIVLPPTWVTEEDWAENWKQYWHVQKLGRRIVVKPSWEPYAPAPQDLVIDLDPGMAFGTGDHPTTVMCLEALESLVKPGYRVLDVGTGSGILSIAAARLGATEVLALDIDPVAVEAARANVERNGLAHVITVRQGVIEDLLIAQADSKVYQDKEDIIQDRRIRSSVDHLSSPYELPTNKQGLLHGANSGGGNVAGSYDHPSSYKRPQGPKLQSTPELDAGRYMTQPDGGRLESSGKLNVTKNFDLAVANIVASVIISITPAVGQVLQPGGIFLASGIIKRDLPSVLAALEQNCFTIKQQITRLDWVTIASNLGT